MTSELLARVPCERILQAYPQDAESIPPLLGPAFETQTAEAFFAFVSSLRDENFRKRRTHIKLGFKGKFLEKPKKRSPFGKYEISFGAVRGCFSFDANRLIDFNKFEEIATMLNAPRDKLRAFLLQKKFFV